MVQRYRGGEKREHVYDNRTRIDISALKHKRVTVNESHKNIRQSWVSLKVNFLNVLAYRS